VPKVSPIKNNFTAGEVSPLLGARIDFVKYKNALEICENAIPLKEGPVVNRPGTHYVATGKAAGITAWRLVPFEFSITQAYILEFGDVYIRFYRNNGQILFGGSPYEIVSPYLGADINKLRFVQSADTLYIFHEKYQPRQLTRTGHTAWTLADVNFRDGPYLPINSTDTTITASGNTGAVTLTASTPIFSAADKGLFIRLKGDFVDVDDCDADGDVAETINAWGYGIISAFLTTTTVSVNVVDRITTNATKFWRKGLMNTGGFGDIGEYPATGTFFENRLFIAGIPSYPQRVDGSRTDDYSNFAPSDCDGTVVGDHAISYTVNSDNVNVIRWLSSVEKGLILGTVGGEWIMRPSTRGEAITPSNIQIKRITKYGSADMASIVADGRVVFAQRDGRLLRDVSYSVDADGFRISDLNLIAAHITKGGMTQLEYQQSPHGLVWAVRSDGVLLSTTYQVDNEVVGWGRHLISGTLAAVESVAVIPKSDGSGDELWMSVKRTVNAVVSRHIEYLETFYEKGDDAHLAWFLDSGLSYNGVPVSSVSGLDHLEGETISILADGAVHPDKVVTAGVVTLDYTASKIIMGLSYNSDIYTLNLEAGSADGVAQGKIKRIHELTARFYQTSNVLVGPDVNNLRRHDFRKVADLMDTAVPLFDGDVVLPWDSGYDKLGKIYIRQDKPLPLTLVALMPRLETYDG